VLHHVLVQLLTTVLVPLCELAPVSLILQSARCPLGKPATTETDDTCYRSGSDTRPVSHSDIFTR